MIVVVIITSLCFLSPPFSPPLPLLSPVLIPCFSQKEEEERQKREKRDIAETKRKEELERRKREVTAFWVCLFHLLTLFLF